MGSVIMVELNKEQKEAKNLILKWYNNGLPEKLCFVLTGYAGTGKTFLVNYIVSEELHLDVDRVAYVAPTGKAASVLAQRGAKNTSTIHKLIYNRVEVEYKTEVNGKTVRSKKFEFVRKPIIPNYKLIIVDETSMVDKKTMEDLVSFGKPLLLCGDLGQLPSIEKSNNLLDKPDYNLTTIVRQSEDNMIVKLATMARNGLPIKTGNYGNVKVLNKNLISENAMKSILTKADQVICGTNKTRFKLNRYIKSSLGLDPNRINEGEKVICLLNNWEKELDIESKYNLVNGIIGYASKIKNNTGIDSIELLTFKPDFLNDESPDLPFDNHVFIDGEFRYQMHQQLYRMDDGSYELKVPFLPKTKDESEDEYNTRLKEFVRLRREALYTEQLNFFDSAYCISCHKSQGSEWDNVVVFDESWIFNESNKWLYTAITRAKKNLIIIK